MKAVYTALAISLFVLTTGTEVVAQSSFEGKERYATFFLGVTQDEDFDFDLIQRTSGQVNGVGIVTTDVGGSAGVILGLRLSASLRGEFELSYASSSTDEYQFPGYPAGDDNGSMSSTFGLFNLWYDMPAKGKLKPYAGGGVGIAHVSQVFITGTGLQFLDDSDVALAGQIGFGLRFEIHQGRMLDIGYRYKMTSDLGFYTNPTSISDIGNSNYASHNFNVGYSFIF